MNAQDVMSPPVQTPDENKAKTPLYQKILVVLCMMTFMGGTLTGVMTYMNLGYTGTFFTDWGSSFLLAATTVMPVGFLLMALLTKLSHALLPNTHDVKRNLLVGVSMALIMESGMAFTTAINNVGFEQQSVFYQAWLDAVMAALPVAITLMLIISTTVKPKIERFLKS
ncbi:DUF2798 domain-containing protein [Enterovibrio norvegicus]|uniref:DUF2798 domain-containing protein n=1 Tax=Enterovibrio norvegicus TaxID=188144 RepID=A0A2N7L528_9GAMM|nr:DUF2798 domain-containing protein [Enterovibrio norvegicus]PMN88627.1 hypothetical protein BCT23_23930 [Enterovibrio norvegicus]